jgi:seryl-tRNA synthetase
MASELRRQVSTGKISWIKAAEQAQETRNLMMEIIRTRSTPVGLAMAQRLKSEGKTLNELIARKTRQLYGKTADFSSLTSTRQNIVYAEIVKSAGKSNPRVTTVMRSLSYAGRGLIVISIALSVYTVATTENKFNAAGREIAITSAGVGGGMAGGAIAGLACGPGAPVCVTVGAFVGGALAAFGVSIIW